MLKRWLYLLLVLSATVFILFPMLQRSSWHKNRLYGRLLSGNPEERLRAASALVYLGGQEQLLRALKTDNAEVRELGRRALEYLWFTSAGQEAYKQLQEVATLTDKKEFRHALRLLALMSDKHPSFAEAWNRRAAIHWQMGEYEQSIEDSARAVALNPHHYGAWQGLGMCHLQTGNYSEARRCLQRALQLIPHDVPTREAAQRCEELMRVYPSPHKQKRPLDLVSK